MERTLASFSKKLIAVLMMAVLFCSLSLPAFAAEKPAPAEALTVSTAAAKKTILIGDSRTANLRQVRVGGPLIKDLIVQDDNILWDFKWGARLTDMVSYLVPRLELSGLDTINNKTKIVIWMGFNDAVNDTGATQDYINYLNLMTALWKARGAKVYYMNIGPAGNRPGATKADKDFYAMRNKKIRAFNKSLKNNLSSQVKYIDCYTYLVNNGYTTTDGTHYNAATSRRVYSFIMQKIK